MEIPIFAMILMTGVGFLVGFLHQVKKKLDKDIAEMEMASCHARTHKPL